MRLTVDVIRQAAQVLNPLMERELTLRGLNIPAIENLGVTADGFDCIDLSDNDIPKLENLPALARLKMLLLSNNRITRVAPEVGKNLPGVDTLVLTNNKISNLAELDHLASFASLRTLSLLENPVTRRPQYRLYVIHHLPELRILDFQKVSKKARVFRGPVSAVSDSVGVPGEDGGWGAVCQRGRQAAGGVQGG